MLLPPGVTVATISYIVGLLPDLLVAVTLTAKEEDEAVHVPHAPAVQVWVPDPPPDRVHDCVAPLVQVEEAALIVPVPPVSVCTLLDVSVTFAEYVKVLAVFVAPLSAVHVAAAPLFVTVQEDPLVHDAVVPVIVQVYCEAPLMTNSIVFRPTLSVADMV